MIIKAIIFDAYGTLYDVQSVIAEADAAFPGYGSVISQIWRLKQLEYSWLQSLIGRYVDFRVVTRQSLAFTLGVLGLQGAADHLDRLVGCYDRLDLYADARSALDQLSDYRLGILSNGSASMLQALVGKDRLDAVFEAVISVDEAEAYKPDPRCYRLVTQRLGLAADNILFVTANGFDICGAKNFGFAVAHIQRVDKVVLSQELRDPAAIGPSAMFKALRSQVEHFGHPPDLVVPSLGDLPARLAAF
jgi:2-haloacid dehalogenase